MVARAVTVQLFQSLLSYDHANEFGILKDVFTRGRELIEAREQAASVKKALSF